MSGSPIPWFTVGKVFVWGCMGGSALAAVALLACVGDTPDKPVSDAGANDTSTTNDTGADTATASDAGDSATTNDAGPYNDMGDSANWTSFDTGTLNTNTVGFAGGAFDGKYVYFAPTCAGTVQECTNYYVTAFVRYDTTKPFTSGSSWERFDANGANFLTAGNSFLGATFDGKYVYFAPISNFNGYNGALVRFDTTKSFTSTGSWESYDVSTPVAGAFGFNGVVADPVNKFLYYVPNSGGGNGGIVTQFDFKSPFSTPSSYVSFNLQNVDNNAVIYGGGVFDGRYVYLAPQSNGMVVQHDTNSAITAGWKKFDTAAGIAAGATKFQTAGFDGTRVYFIPANGGAGSTIVTYDTKTGTFDTAGLWWDKYDLTQVNSAAKGYTGSAFDGRYLHLAPAFGGSIALRYDTTAPLSSKTSWNWYDTTLVAAKAKGFRGAIFDGKNVYFVPFNNGAPSGVVVKFAARTTAAMPSGYSGSFY